MRPYADTNFFTRFYLELPQHRDAVRTVMEASRAGATLLPLTWLLRLEFVNALQLHVFAGRSPGQTRVTPEQAAVALATFREQLGERQFMREVALNASAVEEQFEALSLRHTARHGFRTYDLLHVSSALSLSCDSFWSFDPKANKLAALEGLNVLPASARG
jgi:predicted nucleic acid-binding protein